MGVLAKHVDFENAERALWMSRRTARLWAIVVMGIVMAARLWRTVDRMREMKSTEAILEAVCWSFVVVYALVVSPAFCMIWEEDARVRAWWQRGVAFAISVPLGLAFFFLNMQCTLYADAASVQSEYSCRSIEAGLVPSSQTESITVSLLFGLYAAQLTRRHLVAAVLFRWALMMGQLIARPYSISVFVNVRFVLTHVITLVAILYGLMSTEAQLERRILTNNIIREAAAIASVSAYERTIGYIMHELRNPLHCMSGALWDLRRTLEAKGALADESLQADLGVMEESLHSSRMVIDDALDIRRISQGTVAVRPKRAQFLTAIEDTIAQMGQIARSVNTPMILVGCGSLRQSMHFFDPLRLRQILMNGLTNAVKARARSGSTQPIVVVVKNVSDRSEQCMSGHVEYSMGTARFSPVTMQPPQWMIDFAQELFATPSAAPPALHVCTIQVQIIDPGDGVRANEAGSPQPALSKPPLILSSPVHPTSGARVEWLNTTASNLGLSLSAHIASVLGGSIDLQNRNSTSMRTCIDLLQELDTKIAATHVKSSELPSSQIRLLAQAAIDPSKPGAVFSVTLPALCVHSPASQARATTERTAVNRSSVMGRAPQMEMPASRLRVLVADDDKISRKLLLRMLSTLGVDDASCANNGLEACALMAQAQDSGQPFTLVLTDLSMPGMGGEELAARAREMHPTPTVIACTGSAVLQTHEHFAFCLMKPFGIAELHEAILRATERLS